MSELETVRVWVQFPLGGTHEQRLALANELVAEIGDRAVATIVEDAGDGGGLVIDLRSIEPEDDRATTQLDALVAAACDEVMNKNSSASLMYQSIDSVALPSVDERP